MSVATAESQVERPVKVFLFAIGSTAVFSVMNIIAKMASDHCTVAQILFFRNFIAFFPILLLVRQHGDWSLLKTRDHIGHFWRGFIGVASMACFFASFTMLPMANATAIHFASPLILTILSIPMLGERVGKVRWAAVIVGLCGVLFMAEPGGGAGNMAGNLTAFAAAFLAAFAMIFIRKLGRTEHALTIVFYFTIYGVIGGALAMIFMWQPLDPFTLLMLVIVGLMGGIGQIMLTNAYASAPAAYVAPFSYIAMVFAVLADILVWGIWPGWHIYAGGAVIVGSGLFIVWREATKKKRLNVRTSIYGLQPAQPTEADLKENNKN